MGHRAAGGNAVELVGQRAGRPPAAADVGRTRAVDRRIHALCAARAKFQHRPALGRARDAVGLGGDQALVVERQQQERLDELRLNGRRADRHDRLAREDGRPLRHGPDIAGEAEVSEVVEEALVKHLPAAQILDILLIKTQLADIFDCLLQTGRDGKAAVVRHGAEEDVEIRDAVLHALHKVAVAHGKLVIIAQHREIGLFADIHV